MKKSKAAKALPTPSLPGLEPPQKAAMKIRSDVVLPMAEDAAEPFEMYQPPPGVVAKSIDRKVKKVLGLAMDDAYGNVGYGGLGYSVANSMIGWPNGGFLDDGQLFPGYAVLAQLYQRPEYRNICGTMAREATREWIKLHSNGDQDKQDKVKELHAEMRRLKLREVFRQAFEKEAAYGLIHIFPDLGVDSGPELATPLTMSPKVVTKGRLKGFRTVEPIWTTPNNYDARNPLSGEFYKPSRWWIYGQIVHASRLVSMVTQETPDILKASYNFGGISMIQRVRPYVDDYLRSRQSVSDLLKSFSTTWLKTNMQDVLSGGSGQNTLSRVQAFVQYRDNRGVMALNGGPTEQGGEEAGLFAVPLGTTDKLMAQSQERLGSICNIPMVKLWGVSPAGLNVSTDGEVRTFYDFVLAYQEHHREAIKRCLDLIQLSLWGLIDPDIDFAFIPLWQLDEGARAVMEKTKADTGAVLMAGGVISAEEERERIAGDEESQYHGLDLSQPLPDPPEGEMGAGQGGGLDNEDEEPASSLTKPSKSTAD